MAWGGATPTMLSALAFQSANQATYTIPASGSLTLTSGRLYYIVVHCAHSSSVPDLNQANTLVGNSDQGSFTPVYVNQCGTMDAADPGRMAVWRYIPSENKTTVTFTFDVIGLGSLSCIRAGVMEITSGFDSTTPEAQSATNAADDPNPSQLAVNLSSAPASDALSLLFMTHMDNTELFDTPGGWTELGEVQGTGGTADSGSTAIFYDDATQNVTAATNPGTTTNDLGGIHIEVKAGSVSFTGTAALTVPTPAVAASGTYTPLAITGTGALTVPAPSVAGTGAQVFTGTGALTVPAPAVAGTGEQVFTGTAALTVPTPAVAASGTYTPLAISGTAAITVPVPAVAASGTITENITGTAALTVPAPSVVASGLETFTGTSALTVPAPAVAASGLETFTGTSAITVPVPVVAASGTLVFTGTAAITVPTPAVAGVGTTGESFTGTAALTVPATAVAASGLETFAGTGALTVPTPSVEGSGEHLAPITGTASLTVPTPAVAASGTVTITTFTGTAALTVTAQVSGAGVVTPPSERPRVVTLWAWEHRRDSVRGGFVRG